MDLSKHKNRSPLSNMNRIVVTGPISAERKPGSVRIVETDPSVKEILLYGALAMSVIIGLGVARYYLYDEPAPLVPTSTTTTLIGGR